MIVSNYHKSPPNIQILLYLLSWI